MAFNFNELKKRLLSSFAIIILIIILLIFSENIYGKIFFSILLSIFSTFTVLEYIYLAKSKEVHLLSPLLIICSFLQTFSFFIASQYQHYSELPFFTLFIFSLAIFIFHFRRLQESIIDVAISIFSLLYITVPIGLIFLILYSSKLTVFDGKIAFLYLLIVTKGADIGAYFGGKLFGRHLLSPKISPNKTYEGAIVGFLFSLGLSICFAFFKLITLEKAIFLGIAIGIIGQIGDLSESLFKRDAKTKDSSSLPGLGGLLDMVDSILFTTPLVYFFLI